MVSFYQHLTNEKLELKLIKTFPEFKDLKEKIHTGSCNVTDNEGFIFLFSEKNIYILDTKKEVLTSHLN